MWLLVIFVIIWLLFTGSSDQKTEKTKEKNIPYERRLALGKVELEENIKNKEKYENILSNLRKKMAIKELSDEEVEKIDNRISYAKECIEFFETKIILTPSYVKKNNLWNDILEKNSGNYNKTRKEYRTMISECHKQTSPEREKIIKLYQEILENE